MHSMSRIQYIGLLYLKAPALRSESAWRRLTKSSEFIASSTPRTFVRLERNDCLLKPDATFVNVDSSGDAVRSSVATTLRLLREGLREARQCSNAVQRPKPLSGQQRPTPPRLWTGVGRLQRPGAASQTSPMFPVSATVTAVIPSRQSTVEKRQKGACALVVARNGRPSHSPGPARSPDSGCSRAVGR